MPATHSSNKQKAPTLRPLCGLAAPQGGFFALGRPGGKKRPPRCARCAGLLPPKGAFLPWGGPAAKKGPHAAPAVRACCPPKGAFLPWGGPAAKKGPHAAPAVRACCPPRGLFCLGAARRQKKAPTLRPLCGLAAPRGGFLPWGGPAAKKNRQSMHDRRPTTGGRARPSPDAVRGRGPAASRPRAAFRTGLSDTASRYSPCCHCRTALRRPGRAPRCGPRPLRPRDRARPHPCPPANPPR
ncbi:Uncharacterised protein [Bordetella bronchiseptica]|nr:Uncharacterised protein [Bordetella bronchiseptica]